LEDYFILCSRDIKPHIKQHYPIVNFIEVDGKTCNRLYVETKLQKINEKKFLLVIYCHGSENSFDDPYGEPFIQKDVNDHMLKNAFVFSNSCYSGKELGASVVKKGAKLFSGFLDEAWTYKDYIDEFISCDNYPIKLFLEGHFQDNTINEIKKKIKEFYTKKITEIYKKNLFAASRLRRNRDIYVIYYSPGSQEENQSNPAAAGELK
jgi:hypothetical protein